MKIYLAGPMSGIPQFNFPLFMAVTETLRATGWEVVSPAELDDAEDKGAALSSKDGDPNNRDAMGGKTWGDFLARDVKLIADSGIEGIIFLPGWERSRGARLEASVGLLCGMKFFYWSEHQVEALEVDAHVIAWELYSQNLKVKGAARPA